MSVVGVAHLQECLLDCEIVPWREVRLLAAADAVGELAKVPNVPR
jgi:hypothetical protein